MQKKVTYILSNIDKALAFEWIATHLDKNKFSLDFILLSPGDSVLEKFLAEHNIRSYRILYRGKKDFFKALLQVIKILRKNKPDVVHAHLFDANLVGLIAARFCGIRKRIYTRHHSTYHHVYHPKAVKYDKLANTLATDIVAICKTTEEVLLNQEHVDRYKVHLIHHGFALEDFENVPAAQVEELKAKYNPMSKYPVVGVISRQIELKGIQYIIPAFEKLLQYYPDALLILANATGDYQNQIKTLLQKIPAKNYREIRFENNIFALYKLFDVFVHTPVGKYSESFGQTYVEALASGIPSVFTLSGVANEFISDHQNALVVPYKDPEAVYAAVKELLENKTLARHLSVSGKIGLKGKFGLHNMISSFEKLYLS